ncbi:MAG: stage IV sporulation protein A [Eubacteriales bacterium]|nr:stage IV sporulation protein A [Eubacteriales bacterium]
MEHQKLYEDISRRTGGTIYIGVVGPVRTGKSTLIKRFMETLVLPGIENVYRRERAKDELPQSGSGRTIMTAEPKFVPEEAAEIALDGGSTCKVRLVDCVGYLVDGALGHTEEDEPRMVSTPWSDQPMPMAEAAELGTRKVIADHSTIGLVVTTDGTVTDIPRENYLEAEDRVIRELQGLNKPFLVLVNSTQPQGAAAQQICKQISDTYDVTALAVDCLNMDATQMGSVLKSVLYEFPVREVGIILPPWVGTLPAGHKVKEAVYSGIRGQADHIGRMRDMQTCAKALAQTEYVSDAQVQSMDLGTGSVRLEMRIPQSIFYQIAGEQSGLTIKGEADLIPLLTKLAKIQKEYERFDGALAQVRQTGYGIVLPTIEELKLDEPEIVKQGGRYGVKLTASAPSIHMIRADIQTEVSPIVGSEKQSADLVQYLMSEFDGEPERIWQTNIFGKSLNELVNDGMSTKLMRMPDDARSKLQETLERIINEGSGGLICIIL